ncbi:MAG: amidase [Cyclobacteriaceae bacterium]|jgi:Asp-tRNA(Asn)/Glu-tRNA(Gln) amidotransferase A subunit family amidase
MPRLALLTLVTLLCCAPPQHISRRDIRGAEKIIGIHFSDDEIKTLQRYLAGNRNGYDSVRLVHTTYPTTPALYFDPRPAGFTFRTGTGPSEWPLPADDDQLPTSDDQLAFLSVAELSVLIRSRKISSKRLTSLYLDRLKRFGDTLQTVVTITETLALQQAQRADDELARGLYRGPLHGIPYGLKDLFAVPGYKTTWGAEPYQHQVLTDTAEVYKRLEAAGAVLVAKLTTGALARGDVWFGGKTKNPWDLRQGASGSSAGSASATAAGLVAFAIGTETLGSILAPSARCGATGLRPTFGRVSRAGCMTLAWSMDKVGPICRTALDCALVFEVIRGRSANEQDRAVVDHDFFFRPQRDLSGYRIGYFKKMFDRDTVNKANHERTLALFQKLGAQLVPVALPDSIPYSGFDVILRAEAGAYFDELVLTHQDRQLGEQDASSRANSLRQARFIPAVEYLQANRQRSVLIEKMDRLMRGFDLVLAPAEGRNLSLATNLSGHPAISLPAGFDKKGRPTAITLLGNLYDEAPLLEAALLLQQASDHHRQHPPRFAGK